MKTVWVNRHNADGSMKPMSEWVQRECMERYTHTYPSLNGGHGFDGGGLPAHHCFISTFGKIAESGFFYEYISNQRGDGWFYVADGDLPVGGDENVLAWNLDAHKSVTFKASTLIHHYNRSVTHGLAFVYPCWQPIQPPKHLD